MCKRLVFFYLAAGLFLFFSELKCQPLYFPPLADTTWEDVSPGSLGWRTDSIAPLMSFLESNSTKVFIVLKDGRIALEQYFGSFTRDSHGLALCDVEKDGNLDVVIGMQNPPYGRTYLNHRHDSFTKAQNLSSKFVEKVEIGDLDDDGNADIFLACNGSNEIWLNEGKGHFIDS